MLFKDLSLSQRLFHQSLLVFEKQNYLLALLFTTKFNLQLIQITNYYLNKRIGFDMLNYCFINCIIEQQAYSEFITVSKNFPIEALSSPKIEYQNYFTKKDMPTGKNQKKHRNQYQYTYLRYNEHYLLSTKLLNSQQIQKYIHGSKSLVQMFEVQQMVGEKTLKEKHHPTTQSFKWGNYIFTSIKLPNSNILLFIEDICISTTYKQSMIETEFRQRLKNSFESVTKYVIDINKVHYNDFFKKVADQQLNIIQNVKSLTKQLSKDGYPKDVQILFWMLKKIIVSKTFGFCRSQAQNI